MPPKYKPTRNRKQRHAVRRTHTEEQGADNVPEITDSNAEILIPATKAQKDENRRNEMLEEAKRSGVKMSSKKQKRLRKYIENKLKKEERAELIKKLSESRVDTSLFISTKSMGTARVSKREQIRRALLEEKAGINSEKNKYILYEKRHIADPEDMEVEKEEIEEESEEESEEEEEEEREKVVAREILGFKNIVGAGLKRPLESDADGKPVIKKIKKSKETRLERMKKIIEKAEAEVGIDYDSSGEEEDSQEDSSENEEDRENGESEEEFKGFSDSEVEGDNQDKKDGSEEDDSAESEDEGDEGSEEEEEEEEQQVDRRKRGQSEKANAFKLWALSQRKEVLDDGTPDTSAMPDLLTLKPHVAQTTTRKREDMTPPPELMVPSIERKAYYVTVERPEEIQTARLGLPVVAEEQRIMEAIHNNPCVVICGETGSGKTTQVPQFLYEAGYGSPDSPTPGLIGVTQPRRVAAVSMASRVSNELGPGSRGKVSYQIRFEGTASPNTAIKFMTDGVLLRELAEDFLLRKYSAIVIDEAHERSINTDILIGVMSRVLKLREQMSKEDKITKPLKLVIMSATLRVSDFTENTQLFPKPPPLLQAEARQHPVSIHFSRRTPHDYVEETFKKVCKIHRRLPPGGILVFLTGQNEITALMKRLRSSFPFNEGAKTGPGKHIREPVPLVKILANDATIETEDVELGNLSKPLCGAESDDDSILDDDEDLGEEMASTDTEAPLHVLPLYSLLPTKEQLRVFEDTPEGSRMCVLATNVAETSLTIPGIRYVVDCGRSKERNFDKTTGVQSFDIGWISKASAAQRAGRSGRTGPGHCYRLYSSAVYERDFEEFAEAEILRMPIEGVVLQMKSMNIDTISNFPFPTAPDRPSLAKAEKLLGYLGALGSDGALTELGRTMNVFPLSPRFAKILIIGQQHGCLSYIIAVVAALSVGDVFIPEHQLDIAEPAQDDVAPDNETKIEQTIRANRRKEYYRAHRNFSRLDPTSDVLKLLSVVCAYEYESASTKFCERNFVRLKAMQETHKLRQQITKIVQTNCPGIIESFEAKLTPPSNLQVKAIKQIVAAGFIDQVAIRADLVPNSTFKLGQNTMKQIINIPYYTLFASTVHERSQEPEDTAVYIHPSSVLASQSSYPEYLVYSELKRSSTSTGKIRMKPLTPVTGLQLASLAKGTPLLTYSKPLEHVPPKIIPESGGNRRECWVVPRIGAAIGKSDLGWPLPTKKVVQKREGGSQRWSIE